MAHKACDVCGKKLGASDPLRGTRCSAFSKIEAMLAKHVAPYPDLRAVLETPVSPFLAKAATIFLVAKVAGTVVGYAGLYWAYPALVFGAVFIGTTLFFSNDNLMNVSRWKAFYINSIGMSIGGMLA